MTPEEDHLTRQVRIGIMQAVAVLGTGAGAYFGATALGLSWLIGFSSATCAMAFVGWKVTQKREAPEPPALESYLKSAPEPRMEQFTLETVPLPKRPKPSEPQGLQITESVMILETNEHIWGSPEDLSEEELSLLRFVVPVDLSELCSVAEKLPPVDTMCVVRVRSGEFCARREYEHWKFFRKRPGELHIADDDDHIVLSWVAIPLKKKQPWMGGTRRLCSSRTPEPPKPSPSIPPPKPSPPALPPLQPPFVMILESNEHLWGFPEELSETQRSRLRFVVPIDLSQMRSVSVTKPRYERMCVVRTIEDDLYCAQRNHRCWELFPTVPWDDGQHLVNDDEAIVVSWVAIPLNKKQPWREELDE